HRAALETRRARRRVKETQVSARPEPEAPAAPEVGDDLRAVLDEELSRLPDQLREAVWLSRLEGHPLREAAGRRLAAQPPQGRRPDARPPGARRRPGGRGEARPRGSWWSPWLPRAARGCFRRTRRPPRSRPPQRGPRGARRPRDARPRGPPSRGG